MRRVLSVRRGWAVAVAVAALVGAGAVQAWVSSDDGAAKGDAQVAEGRNASGVTTDDRQAREGASRSTLAPGVVTDDRLAGQGASRSAATGSTGSATMAGSPDIATAPGIGLPAPDPDPSPVDPASPRIVRTADLRVKVSKGGFGAAFDRVAAVAAANGGFVSSSSTASADDARSGELTVRVPGERFDAARQGLSALGEVESQAIRGEDVSGRLVDYDARLKTLRAQEEALRALVGQAKTVGEVMQVQSSLFSVRQQIEQITAQRAHLDQSAALATIRISLFEPGAAVVRPGEGNALSRSFERAVDGMLAVVGGMIVVVGWLVPLVVLALLVWAGSRLFRRRPPAPVPAAPAA